MQYQTIVLEILQQRPHLYHHLCASRKVSTALTLLAGELRARHQHRKDCLSQGKAEGDSPLIAGEALELALQEVESALPPDSPPAEDEMLSLDEAMAFLRRYTPPG